jgi:DNA-dependent metalloprotease WSS1
MDTMLHELAHNVHGEHDKHFYALLEEITKEWELLSSKGYKGEGFFSQGQRLGKGHVFYKPSIGATAADRRRIKDAVERREKGINIGPGRRLGGPEDSPTEGQSMGQTNGQILGEPLGGYRLGGGFGGENFMDPRRLAAIAAERRASDQKRCGAKHASGDMRRETQKAQKEGMKTQAKDMPTIIDLDDIQDYDLEDSIMNLSLPTGSSNGATKTGAGPGDWICNLCTFVNPPLYLACKLCETERILDQNPSINHPRSDASRKPLAPGPSFDDFIDLTEEYEQPWKKGDNAQTWINKGTGNSWNCHACTYKNENVMDGKCGVCGTKREEDDIFDFL